MFGFHNRTFKRRASKSTTYATYTLVLPSTGQQVEFRPYLVKEEKILMLAQESRDSKQILSAMCQIVENCTFGKIDVNGDGELSLQEFKEGFQLLGIW